MSGGSGKPGSFWTTLPGILTGVAALVTAVGGLLGVLCQVGVICGDDGGGEVAEVTVHAKREFTATPFVVNPGDFVTVEADGEVFDDVAAHPRRSFPPEGVPDPENQHPGDPLGTANHAALIGRIGEEGELFEIGRAISFESSASGRLFLGVNDGLFTDNAGEYVAAVRVVRAGAVSTSREPEPSVQALASRASRRRVRAGESSPPASTGKGMGHSAVAPAWE